MSLPRYQPMLATPWREPFSDPEWMFEEKMDGFRTLLYWDGDAVELRTRTGRDVTALYPELTAFSASRPCVIDGEAVVRDPEGVPRFELMQHRSGVVTAAVRAQYPVDFVAFDVLFDDEELIAEPLETRHRRLLALAGELTVTAPIVGDGLALWERVEALRLEGMVAKRVGSSYLPGVRGDSWRKVARINTVRVVVGGFTAGQGSRLGTFGSLQVGLWKNGMLRWVGSVGTGFSDAMLTAIREALDSQATEHSPFAPDADMPPRVTWVEPQLVAMVGIKEWTSFGRMRAPRFVGFTDDDPQSVTWESERIP